MSAREEGRCAPEDNGVRCNCDGRSSVVRECSLVVRLVLLPFEESSYTTFARRRQAEKKEIADFSKRCFEACYINWYAVPVDLLFMGCD
ncbi:hypothetical protein Tco_1252058 [Tanacetum coccineum]